MTEYKKDPINCSCKKIKCPRYLDCEACRAYHYKTGKKPHCERRKLSIFSKKKA